MTQEHLIGMIQIYNTFTTISTKGEDTLTMADCLRAFRSLIEDLQEELKKDSNQE